MAKERVLRRDSRFPSSSSASTMSPPRSEPSVQIDTTVEVEEMYGRRQTVIGRDIEGREDVEGSDSTRVVVKKMVSDETATVVGKRSRVVRAGNES